MELSRKSENGNPQTRTVRHGMKKVKEKNDGSEIDNTPESWVLSLTVEIRLMMPEKIYHDAFTSLASSFVIKRTIEGCISSNKFGTQRRARNLIIREEIENVKSIRKRSRHLLIATQREI